MSGSDAKGYRLSVKVGDGHRELSDILDMLDLLPVELGTRRVDVSITVAF